MSIYDFINHFWLKNENDPCSLSEMALYYYLLYEVNRQHWNTPFKVSTQMLVARLGTSKQNIMKARESLMKRGLIHFTQGEGKGKPALYTLCLEASNDKTERSQKLTQPLTQILTPTLSQPMTPNLTSVLPLIKKQKEDMIHLHENEESNHVSSSYSKVMLTLSELHEKLLNDDLWLLNLSEQLAKVGINFSRDSIKEMVAEYFNEQQVKGIAEKDEEDCRSHIFNWIKYHSKKKYVQRNDSRNERKTDRIEISANKPEDYTGTC